MDFITIECHHSIRGIRWLDTVGWL